MKKWGKKKTAADVENASFALQNSTVFSTSKL